LILAVPPRSLSALLDPELGSAAVELRSVRDLHSQPICSLDVYFHRRLPDIPSSIAALLDSKYRLAFLDNSQLWPRQTTKDVTFLNVAASNYEELAADSIGEMIERILHELRHYIRFEHDQRTKLDDVDRERSHLQTNVSAELFLNRIGSWPLRPRTNCSIPNLFIAGDFCQHVIDVVSIEGAVVSGLMAAEAVRKRAAVGNSIEIVEPKAYPRFALQAIKLAGTPHAYAAKGWAMLCGVLREGYEEMFPNG
jgi:hypothetical protein